MDGITRVPPNSMEAEQAVLGGMFFGLDAITMAAENLHADDFYSPAHKIIFKNMIELFAKNIPMDLVTLKNRLDEQSLTENVGGRDYLITLASSVSTWANMEHYIDIVKNKSILRKLIRASNNISAQSYEEKHAVENIIDNAEREIFNIVQDQNSVDFSHISEVMAESIEKIELAAKNKNRITGIETGFTDLDKKTAGLQPSDFILIAARPSMGKTAFALNVAQYAAMRNNIPVAIFSLEMSKLQLVNRFLAAEAMLDSQKLRVGDLESDDWIKIAESLGTISNAPIYINDTPGISSMEIRAKCRKLKMDKGLGMVLIDYLQLMSAGVSTNNRQQEISDISRSLKGLARELNVPVIALSQLSRAVEARADKRPMLSDLRESGAIEQDADVVAFLYRDEYYNPETDKPNQAELIIAKQRNGPTGTVDLAWVSKYTKFANLQY